MKKRIFIPLSILLCIILSFMPYLTGCHCPAAKALPEEKKIIYLTFDDGPTDSTTPKVLDILFEKKVRATFFVIGRQIKTREKILQRIADGGHMIGIHSYSHEYNKIYASPEALLEDIGLCRDAIRKVLPAFDGHLYRFPGGSFLCKQYRETVLDAGFRYYDWNASADDAVYPCASPNELYGNVVRSSADKNQVILLMHDGVGYKSTIACLPNVIDYFLNKNYIFDVLL